MKTKFQNVTARANAMMHADWLLKYIPIENKVTPHWQCGGKLFETFGADFEFVQAQNPLCVWTFIDNNDGWQGITNGLHFVNRIGYFVSSVPFEHEGQFLEVTTSDDEDEHECARDDFDDLDDMFKD